MGFPMAFPLKPPFSYGFQQPLRFLWQCWDLVSAPFLAGLRRQNASKPGAWRSVVLIHGNSGWCRRVHMAVIWWWWENLNRKPWFFLPWNWLGFLWFLWFDLRFFFQLSVAMWHGHHQWCQVSLKWSHWGIEVLRISRLRWKQNETNTWIMSSTVTFSDPVSQITSDFVSTYI